jgi:hypothetical protein
MASVPVQLNYFAFLVRIENEADRRLIPEGKLNVYDFPALRTQSKKAVERALQKFFKRKPADIKFAANATVAAALPEGRILPMYISRTAHNLRGFRVEVPEDDLEKSHYDIRGKASFFDKNEGAEHLQDFAVDRDGGQLMAMRHGDDVAILILQFESLEETDNDSDEPFYNTSFENVFGATVYSTRQSWSADELAGMAEGRVVDYGRAKAEIPGKDGKWVLVGDILLHSKERRFVGRGAVLYNPKREIAAEGAEIMVPADEPETYEVSG